MVCFVFYLSAGRRMALHKPKTTSQQPINRREVLRAGLQSLAQQRELREQQGLCQSNTVCRKGVRSDRRRAAIITQVLA